MEADRVERGTRASRGFAFASIPLLLVLITLP